jgi:hypothetical protein
MRLRIARRGFLFIPIYDDLYSISIVIGLMYMKDVVGVRLGGPTVGNLRLLGVSSGIFVVVSETEISNTVLLLVCTVVFEYCM